MKNRLLFLVYMKLIYQRGYLNFYTNMNNNWYFNYTGFKV